jgi:hypothetical protein
MLMRDIAQLVRSKNVGPFLLTIDIIFNSKEVFEIAQSSKVLTAEFFSRLYQVEQTNVSIVWHEPALAFKATFPRPFTSGSLQDGDIYGGQYHSPLVNQSLFPEKEGESAI